MKEIMSMRKDLFISEQLVKLRSRDLKNGLRRFILLLDVGILYTLIIMEDFFKIIFFCCFFWPKRPKKAIFKDIF